MIYLKESLTLIIGKLDMLVNFIFADVYCFYILLFFKIWLLFILQAMSLITVKRHPRKIKSYSLVLLY